MSRRRRVAGVLTCAALVVAACGGDDGGDAGVASTTSAAPGGAAAGPTVGIGDPTFPELGTTDVDVVHYDLDLAWDPATATLDATAVLSVVLRTDVEEVALDFAGLEVAAVTVAVGDPPAEPAPADHEVGDGKLRVAVPEAAVEGDPLRIAVDYGGAPQPVQSVAPIPIGWLVLGDGVVATMAEPDAAHTIFPANDHPLDKATFRTTIRVPEGLWGVGNGVLVDERTEAGITSSTWAMDQPMAPYLLLVAVDDFSVRDQGTPSGVPMRNHLPPGEESTFSSGLGGQPDMLGFLVDRLGPYPFLEYGAVVVPGGPVALETQGRSVFQGPSARDRATVIHELAHQWLGNSVSVTHWGRDLWWVEGFARFAEWLWAERRGGAGEYHALAEVAHESLRFGDQVAIGDLDAASLFGRATYDGGALVFYDLRQRVGDEALWAGLQLFTDRHRHANATTDDLVAALSEASGQDLAPVVAAWLDGGDLPALTFG